MVWVVVSMSVSKKIPKNSPQAHDRVKLRGREIIGTLKQETNKWCLVNWDSTNKEVGPRICHLYELEKMS